MQSRFAIVLMSIAGAGLLFCVGLVFGLGVMSSPKGGEHKEIAVTNEPVKVARSETTGSNGNSERALTPLTPVHPGTSAPAQASAPQPAASPQAASATPAQAQPAPAATAQASAAPAQAVPAPAAQATAQPPAPASQAAAQPQTAADPAPKEAKATPAPQHMPARSAASEKPAAGPANATPVSLHAKNSCDVQACSRAYKSFRESDCTYQPYSGPRQLCVSPPAPAREASRGDDRSAPVRVHRGDRDVEVQNVARERVTDGASRRDDDGPVLRRQIRRDVTADGEDDAIDDSRVIVRRSDDDRRDYRDGGWTRSFLAPVEDDDDDQ
jgi:hypothetical protein